MRVEDFVDFCREHEHLICYGGGANAKNTVTYLKERDIHPEACIVTAKPPIDTFMKDIPYSAIDDFVVSSNTRYGVFLALQEMYHAECKEHVRKKFGNHADIFTLSEYDVEDLTSVLRKEHAIKILSEPILMEQSTLEKYEERIKNIRKDYCRILVRFIYMELFGGVSSWIYYKHERERLFDDGLFHLFFPATLVDRPEKYLVGDNGYLLSKLRDKGMEMLSRSNLDFWRYFWQKHRRLFVLDNGYSRYDWMNSLFNTFTCQHDFSGYGSFIKFSSEEEAKGRNIANEMGLTKPYVCFSARDTSQETENQLMQSDTKQRNSHYRNSNIENCRLAMESLEKYGLTAVRMGAMVGKAINWDNTIDYASNYRTEFMDLWLAQHCSFFASTPSGIDALALLCSKPMVEYDAVNVTVRGDHGETVSVKRDLIIFKRFWYPNENRYLRLHEMLEAEVDHTVHEMATSTISKIFNDMGIVPIENSPKEIADVIEEMVLRIKGEMIYSEEDERLVQRYYDIIDNFPLEYNFPLLMRPGIQFLRDWPEFLD